MPFGLCPIWKFFYLFILFIFFGSVQFFGEAHLPLQRRLVYVGPRPPRGRWTIKASARICGRGRIKILGRLRPEILVSLFPSFRLCWISLANGNSAWQERWDGWRAVEEGGVWQRETCGGETPSVGTAAFFFFPLLFLLLGAFWVQTAGVGEAGEAGRSLLVDRVCLELLPCEVWKVSNLAQELWGALEWLEMTGAKDPCGQLSAANGVWYVAAGRLCFGSAAEDLQESPPRSLPVTQCFFFFFLPTHLHLNSNYTATRKVATCERKHTCVQGSNDFVFA